MAQIRHARESGHLAAQEASGFLLSQESRTMSTRENLAKDFFFDEACTEFLKKA